MIRLEIDPLMFGITLAVFLLMIALLNSWLYRPMLAYMQDRDANIKSGLAEAGSNDSEIIKLEEKAASIINDAKVEAAKLREKVLEDAKLLASSKLEARRNELDAEYSKFSKELETERTEMKSSLAAQAPVFKEALKSKFSQI